MSACGNQLIIISNAYFNLVTGFSYKVSELSFGEIQGKQVVSKPTI